MTANQIGQLLQSGIFPKGSANTAFIETHANWIILTGDFAYKIKRPVRFSFLDFSTPSLRKHHCEEEVRLNGRLTDIYLGVEPVVKTASGFGIGLEGDIVDYAVVMRRLDPQRQMHTLLEAGAVTPGQIQALGRLLADFHKAARIVYHDKTPESLLADFLDIHSVQQVLSKFFGPKTLQDLDKWTQLVRKVLSRLEQRIAERNALGFVRDGHGDLHCANIFLLDKPVVFDCIEFNEHFRINDVLNEMAFLSMDLDRYSRPGLRRLLMQTYQENFPCLLNDHDELLFRYYLFYRASVRLKVIALRAKETLQEGNTPPEQDQHQLELLLGLTHRYAGDLR